GRADEARSTSGCRRRNQGAVARRKCWPIEAGAPRDCRGVKPKEDVMTIGLVGRKVGMTRIFTDDGGTLPVTVLDVSDNRIAQIKTAETDGYAAVQVAFGKRRASRV